LLYVLLGLVVANLAMTGLLYQRTAPSSRGGVGEVALPAYLTGPTLAELAERIRANFNTKNWSTLYSEFDAVAQVQFSQQKLAEQFERLSPIIGQIERAEYSHHRFLGRQDAGNAFELHYQLQVSGGTFSAGLMTVTFIDRGDHAGLFSVFINGRSQ